MIKGALLEEGQPHLGRHLRSGTSIPSFKGTMMLRMTKVLLSAVLLTVTAACSDSGASSDTQDTSPSADARRAPGTGPSAPILTPQQKAAALACNQEKRSNGGQPKNNGQCKKSCDEKLLPQAECDTYFKPDLRSLFERSSCDNDIQNPKQCTIECQKQYDQGKEPHAACEVVCPDKVCSVSESFTR